MRARVFRHAQAIRLRSAGQDVADALHSLGYDAVTDVRQGKYFELDIDATERARRRRWRPKSADKLLANPVIESYRIEVEELTHEVRGRCLPRLQLRSRRVLRRASMCSASRPSTSGTRTPSLKGADVVILPGGFAHGDYLRTGAMARFSPIMRGGADVRGRGRAGARHLQRLSGSARGRPAAGRDAAEPKR